MITHLPHGKSIVKGKFTEWENISCYHPIMDKIDTEINDILLYIAKRIEALPVGTGRGEFAKKLGFKTSKNLNDFLGYAQEINEGGKLPKPELRTAYRLLRGFLEKPPIDIRKPKFTGDKERVFNQFMEIIAESESIDEGKSCETLIDMIDFTYHKFSEIKKKVIKKRV